MKKGGQDSLKIVWITFWILLLPSIVIAVTIFTSLADSVTFDFISMMTGSKMVIAGDGMNLYDPALQKIYQRVILEPLGIGPGSETSFLPYLNLPALLVIFIPFSFLPFLIAYKAYSVILAGVLFLISYLVPRFFKNLNFYSVWPLIPFLYYPAIGSVFIGQTSVLLTILFFAIYYLLRKEKFYVLGLIASLLFMKIQYIIFLPLLLILVNEKKKFVSGLIIGSIAVWGVSFILAGNFLGSYIALLRDAQKPEYGLLDNKMFTFYATLRQMGYFAGYSFNKLFSLNAFFYVSSLTIFFYLRRKISLERKYIIAILLTLVFCIHGVDYDLSVLLLPVLILSDLIKSEKHSRLSVDYVSVVAMALTPLAILTGEGIYTSVVILATIILTTIPDIMPDKNRLLRKKD